MKKLLIFGNSVMAEVALFYFNRDSEYEVLGFCVDQEFIENNKFCNLPVFPFEEVEKSHPCSEIDFFIAIGPTKMNVVREGKFLAVKSKGYHCASYISPYAICDSKIPENCYIADHAIINPNVELSANTYIYEQVIVSAHATIDKNCYIAPKAYIGSYSFVRNNCILGVNCIIKSKVTVKQYSLIGSNCYIAKDTEEQGVYGIKGSECFGNISKKIDISKNYV